MGNIQEYKCPCCGGAIHFDSTIQKMKCPYCDTEFEMEALRGYDEALNQEQSDEMVWDTSAGEEWGEGETDGLRTYQCQSCGGEIVADENMAASACPYCGNPIVVTGQFSGALKPDYVIPFKLDKKAAKDGLMRHLRDNGIAISGSAQKRQLINTGYYHGYKGYRFFKSAGNRLPFTSYQELYATIEYDAALKSLFYGKMMFIETAVKNIARTFATQLLTMPSFSTPDSAALIPLRR